MQAEDHKDPLFVNKIAAAVLAAGLLVIGMPQLINAVLNLGHHAGAGEELHLAYCCVDLETQAGPAPADGGEPLPARLAAASASSGERRAALCKSCHTFEEGGANGTGPNLWNIVGRPVASHPGFNFTGALQNFGGEWTYERLDAFLENSQNYVPGTAMVQRLGRDDQRAEILAFLQTLSDSPVPFPEPAEDAAGAEEGAAVEAEQEGGEGGEAAHTDDDAADAGDDGADH